MVLPVLGAEAVQQEAVAVPPVLVEACPERSEKKGDRPSSCKRRIWAVLEKAGVPVRVAAVTVVVWVPNRGSAALSSIHGRTPN